MADETFDASLRKKLEQEAESRIKLAQSRLEIYSQEMFGGERLERTPERELERARADVDLKKAKAEQVALRQQLDRFAAGPVAEANAGMHGLWKEVEEREVLEAEAKASAARADAKAPAATMEEFTSRAGTAMFADQALDNVKERQADAHDEPVKEKIRGCTPKVIAIVGPVVAAIGLVVFLAGRGDDKTTNDIVAQVESSANAGGGGGGDLSSFAGHYVLVEGLDDPTGLDASGQGGLPSGSTGAGSATIDVNNSGAITGGSYHASYDGGGCHRTGDGSGATGSVTAGGTGSVIFTVSHTNDGSACRSESFAFNMMYQFGISGDDLYMCRSNMETLTTCAAAYPRLVARFHKG